MSGVDVLEVMDEAAGYVDSTTRSPSMFRELHEARAAVAELIEAAQELDEELDGPAIAHRLRAALANVTGGVK